MNPREAIAAQKTIFTIQIEQYKRIFESFPKD